MKFKPKYTKDSFSKLDQYGAYIPTIANLIVELQRAYAEIERLEDKAYLMEDNWKVCKEHNRKISEQNKTLREALEWYTRISFHDGGRVAREALEKAK